MERLKERLLVADKADERSSRHALHMADDRNLTPHTYNEELAKEIAGRIPQHATILSAWLHSCQKQSKT